MADNNTSTSKRRILPELGENYRRDIFAMRQILFGIFIGILGNVLVTASFELIKNLQGGIISNGILVLILILSVLVILLPVIIIFQNFIFLRREKWGVTIVASGSQRYTIGDSFTISGTCLTDSNTVKIRFFKEKQLGKSIYETFVPIEDNFTYQLSFNTSGYEKGIYRIIAENDNGAFASASIILVD